MKKIIVFTGSFNPITIAHYKIISDAVEKFDADEGVFVITNDKYLEYKSLLKVKNPSSFRLSSQTRSEMINSLANDNPKLNYWGKELGGAAPSTYKTLVKFMKDKVKQYPCEEIKLYYLFGADKLKGISNWNHAEEIIGLCDFIVYVRNKDIEQIIKNNPLLDENRNRIHVMEVENEDLEDVSSTEVRRRFFGGEDYSSLMNKGPYEILQKFSPKDFPPVSNEDLIKAYLNSPSGHSKSDAARFVYGLNVKLFKSWPNWLGNKNEHSIAKVYDKPFTVNSSKQYNTEFGCVNKDCVDVAKELLGEGLNPVILNLASRTSPGGGYHLGYMAQEETLCFESTLSQSLYSVGNIKYKHIRESGVPVGNCAYPMDLNFGGIYSPCVTFFRNNVDNSFEFRDGTFDCPVVSVASLSCKQPKDDDKKRKTKPKVNIELVYFNNGYLTDEGREIESNKIRTIFRIALDNGHDSIVLGAFGCGAYRMNKEEVAALFKDILEEKEFKNKFKKLVFAIYEGIPSPRKDPMGVDGKFEPFYRIFG